MNKNKLPSQKALKKLKAILLVTKNQEEAADLIGCSVSSIQKWLVKPKQMMVKWEDEIYRVYDDKKEVIFRVEKLKG